MLGFSVIYCAIGLTKGFPKVISPFAAFWSAASDPRVNCLATLSAFKVDISLWSFLGIKFSTSMFLKKAIWFLFLKFPFSPFAKYSDKSLHILAWFLSQFGLIFLFVCIGSFL